jgi:hypothetical protein
MQPYYQNFIGHNTDYYLVQFARLAEPKAPISWNWGAFFFGFLWALYRKMYGIAAVWLFAQMLVVMLTHTVAMPLLLCLYAGFALMANKLYYAHSNAKIASTLSINVDDDIKTRLLRSTGGVNRWVAIVGAIGAVVLVLGVVASLALAPKQANAELETPGPWTKY